MEKDNVEARVEFGKWLMDIAKYITTAVLLAAVFGNIRELWAVCVLSSLAIVTTLCGGLLLIRTAKGRKE